MSDWIGIAKEPNWDGYGGKPTAAAAIETARYMTGVPMGDGGLQLEMHAGGASVEIVVRPDGIVNSVFFERRMIWTQDILDTAHARAERLHAFLNAPQDAESGVPNPLPPVTAE